MSQLTMFLRNIKLRVEEVSEQGHEDTAVDGAREESWVLAARQMGGWLVLRLLLPAVQMMGYDEDMQRSM